MEYLASAAQTAGQGAATAGQAIGNAATSAAGGLQNAAAGLLQNPEASYLQGLGQQVPQGVQLVGPQSGGFADFGRGLLQGYTGVQGTGEVGGFSPHGIGNVLGGAAAGGGGGRGQDIGAVLTLLQHMMGQQ